MFLVVVNTGDEGGPSLVPPSPSKVYVSVGALLSACPLHSTPPPPPLEVLISYSDSTASSFSGVISPPTETLPPFSLSLSVAGRGGMQEMLTRRSRGTL